MKNFNDLLKDALDAINHQGETIFDMAGIDPKDHKVIKEKMDNVYIALEEKRFGQKSEALQLFLKDVKSFPEMFVAMYLYGEMVKDLDRRVLSDGVIVANMMKLLDDE